MAVLSLLAISLATASGAFPSSGLANKNDFKVQNASASLSNTISTIDVSGKIDAGLTDTGYRLKVQPIFTVTQDCVSTANPAVHQTVNASFNRFDTAQVVSSTTLDRRGNHDDFTIHVTFTTPTDGSGFFSRCPTGFLPVTLGQTVPQFNVIGASIVVYPSLGLITSPPPTKQGDPLLFSETFRL